MPKTCPRCRRRPGRKMNSGLCDPCIQQLLRTYAREIDEARRRRKKPGKK